MGSVRRWGEAVFCIFEFLNIRDGEWWVVKHADTYMKKMGVGDVLRARNDREKQGFLRGRMHHVAPIRVGDAYFSRILGDIRHEFEGGRAFSAIGNRS